MTPWVVFPTANPQLASATLAVWRAMGYRTAVLANGPARDASIEHVDVIVREEVYRGWGRSINHLATLLEGDWLVGAGDDMLPDPNLRADAIAAQCTQHFAGTFGVMQPTGDRFMTDERGLAVSERICGSPWLGREFIQRWNGGAGAFWPDYYHLAADEEMREVTLAAGVLWQRRDLTHHHDHHTRGSNPRMQYHNNVSANADHDLRLFANRKALGFPGHAPLPRAQ